MFTTDKGQQMETTQQHTPKYRADVKGRIRVLMQECTDMFRGELNASDSFCFEYEDCTSTVSEYASYLTPQELQRCFKAALKAAA